MLDLEFLQTAVDSELWWLKSYSQPIMHVAASSPLGM